MSATTWLIIAIVGFSLSGITLIAAIFMFIKLNIPAVIGDLSGKTVAREIQAMRDANESSGNKIHRSSKVNADRGRLTEKVKEYSDNGSVMAMAHSSKRLDKISDERESLVEIQQKFQNQNNGSTTETLSQNVSEIALDEKRVTDVLSEQKQTEVLIEGKETEMLVQLKITELLTPQNQTEVLSDIVDEKEINVGNATTVLSDTEEMKEQQQVTSGVFKVTKSIIVTHTDEVL